MDPQGVEIEVSGWYVVRSYLGTILVLKRERGSDLAVCEILNGPFSHRQDASSAAAGVSDSRR